MKFNIGDKAVEKRDVKARTSYNVYQVMGVLGVSLLVKWHGSSYEEGNISTLDDAEELFDKPGSRSFREGIIRLVEEELFTLAEAEAERARLETIQSKMDEEFSEVRDQVQEKMDQAADLVKEAHALIKPCDRDFFDIKRECMSLYRALDDGGWSHSHMSC